MTTGVAQHVPTCRQHVAVACWSAVGQLQMRKRFTACISYYPMAMFTFPLAVHCGRTVDHEYSCYVRTMHGDAR